MTLASAVAFALALASQEPPPSDAPPSDPPPSDATPADAPPADAPPADAPPSDATPATTTAPATASPWTTGPDAPAPTAPAPFPQAPREPGAQTELLDVPPRPADPVRPRVDVVGVGGAAVLADPRMSTTRTRADLFARGALDPDSALVDVPGLWLHHEQAGSSRLLLRGRDDRDVDVVVDGVPLFDLGGLVPPLEQLSNASTARMVLHHGPRALTTSPRGAAGALVVDSLDDMRDQGEDFSLRGALGGGYGGADLEKGVFTYAETGYGRARVGVHAELLDREDERLGRGNLRAVAGQEPGGVLPRSFGDGGAVGARVDIAPRPAVGAPAGALGSPSTTHVFTTWHSSRSIETPHPELCRRLDGNGRAGDCVETNERGVDVWIAGVDQGVDVGGIALVAHGRAHAQHAVAKDEHSGTLIAVDDKANDDGVRGGARAWLDAKLPPIALGDVWTPRMTIGADAYADRFSSTFFSRSTLRRDAEPVGDGIPDPSRARLADGSTQDFGALSAQASLDGQRTTLWLAGRIEGGTALAAAPTPAAPTPAATSNDASGVVVGEAGVRARLLEPLSAWFAATHLAHDDGLEAGLTLALPWLDVDAAFYGNTRSPNARVDGGAGGDDDDDTVAYGAELAARLKPGVEGLVASTALWVVTVDTGALTDANKAPASRVPNPAGVVELAYDLPPSSSPSSPASIRAGFFSRARFLLPQQRLSADEQLDRGLCPELPSDDDLAAGALQQSPCGGAVGAFLFDVGAHLDVGAFRIDAAALNLLDQDGALRDEPIGFGGTSFRATLTLAL